MRWGGPGAGERAANLLTWVHWGGALPPAALLSLVSSAVRSHLALTYAALWANGASLNDTFSSSVIDILLGCRSGCLSERLLKAEKSHPCEWPACNSGTCSAWKPAGLEGSSRGLPAEAGLCPSCGWTRARATWAQCAGLTLVGSGGTAATLTENKGSGTRQVAKLLLKIGNRAAAVLIPAATARERVSGV